MGDGRCACGETHVLPPANGAIEAVDDKKEHSRSPVDLGVLPIVDDLLNNLKVERLGQVLLDQGDPFLGGHRCHGGQVLPGQGVRTRGADSVARLSSNKSQGKWVGG